jgi:DNA-directed RNA polymerase subunit RPC12/RpoP
MKLVSLTCHNCRAQLDIDLDNLQAKCPYCGAKLMIELERMEEFLTEREKTRRTILREQEKTKRMGMAYENAEKESKRESRGATFALIMSIVLMVGIFGYLDYSERQAEKKHEESVRTLKQIENEIDNAITNNDYETARLATNKLYCDDSFSKDEKETWEKKRNDYIDLIEELEENYISPEDIFLPESSSHYKGENYQDVADQLKELGFTNITSQKSTKEASLFHKAGTVEHMLIGGQEKFKKNDKFDMNTPIILYYYYEE